jgi:hypothetical protein
MAGITRAEESQKVSATTSVVKPRLHEDYGKLPLSFEANQGQLDSQVKFLSRGRGYSLFLTPTGAVLSLRKVEGNRGIDTAVLRMHLVESNPEPKIAGREELPGKANYFVGNDPAKWRTNVPTYARVHYHEIYPGIDLVYYGTQRQLEYDFVVSPGADPKAIRLAFEGVDGVAIDGLGDLVLRADEREVRLRKPVVYQEHDGRRAVIPAGYVLRDEGQVSFEVAAFDTTKPLIIDPVLAYSTYLGGGGVDEGTAIAVDGAGNAYVTGTSDSDGVGRFGDPFPTTDGTTFPGGIFVTKLNPAGSALVYSTFLGPGNALAIAVDAAGNAYVTGFTSFDDFPTTPGAFQITFRGGGFFDSDAFVTKLNATGSVLEYSTFLGGSSGDEARGIAVDAAGNAYVTGVTGSTDFPTTSGAVDTTRRGVADTFVAKLDPTGSALVYSTFLGHRDSDEGRAIAVDAAGSAYVTGSAATDEIPFPTTPGALPCTFSGRRGAFVTKLSPAGSALVYSACLGGSGVNRGSGIAVDAAGNTYVTGSTTSSDFPTTDGAFQITIGGFRDAFVTKLNADGSALVYSTFLGGSDDDDGFAIAVDAAGSAYVTGNAFSDDFPIADAVRARSGGFVTKLNPTGSALVYSTTELGEAGIAVDAAGSAYVTGLAGSGLPTTPGAFQTTLSPSGIPDFELVDAFVAKFLPAEFTPSGSNVAVTPADSASSATLSTPVALTFSSVGQAGTTTLTTSTSGPPPPAGFRPGSPPTYFDITTTAAFSSSVQVCINYTGITFSAFNTTAGLLRLMHFAGTGFVDVTTSLDRTAAVICGLVNSLSPFAIFEPEAQSARPFATFAARVEIEVERHERELETKATFTLGDGSDGIDPLTEAVSFQVGPFSTTIPAGRFKKDTKGRFKFEGVIDGVALEAVIRPLYGGRFEFKAEGKGANLPGMTNPVEVTLTIGNDGGNTISVKAKHDD